MSAKNSNKLAVWAVTEKGADLAVKIIENLPDASCYLSANLKKRANTFTFNALSIKLSEIFNEYNGHIFIMSTGIVVRIIAPLIRHKTVDPAVVVADEIGRHVISLISGHIGGANALAVTVAKLTGAIPVITTATDLNNVLAVDVIARKKNLFFENPDAIKHVNMAFLSGTNVFLYDSFGYFDDVIYSGCKQLVKIQNSDFCNIDHNIPSVFIDDKLIDLPSNSKVLVLRPGSLVAGMGCNRNTNAGEMKQFLFEILDRYMLSLKSLTCIATIDIKRDEKGLLSLVKDIDLEIKYFNKNELSQVVNIKNPSSLVEKHIGVKSVCEAAAILASKNGILIVPKHSTKNVTVAIARIPFIS